MNELPPRSGDQHKVDAKHLEILSIFHFVGASLAILGILFLLAHYTALHAVFSNPKLWEDQKPPFNPADFFAAFKWFYLVFGGWFLASGILNLMSGFCLRVRKHRTFSLIVAGINCLHVPLGTVLGVFTFIVLVRDSMRELYAA